MVDVFAAFKNLNVLIVGDVMIDRYLNGTVDRISPEAPVPVVQLQNRENRLGGAANVALNIAALGATPYLCSVIGVDDAAEAFLKMLPVYGLSNQGIIQSSHRRTTLKVRVLASHQQLLRVDTEDTHNLTTEESDEFLKKVINILSQRKIDVILFQDYNKGVLTEQIIRSIIAEAIKRGIPTAVDPKFKNFNTYKRVNLFKPNLLEVNRFFQTSINPVLEDLHVASKRIEDELENDYTLITLSDKGLYLKREGVGTIYPTHIRTISDVCGAGDSVISVVALALALDLPKEQIALLANLAGGQVCEQLGVVPINLEQLKEEYQQIQDN